MRDESDVWQALLRRKGLSVTDLAGQLGVTRQHAHWLLTGRRPAETQRAELESALALGTPSNGRPLFAIGELDDDGELDLVPAGEAQPCSQTGTWRRLSPGSWKRLRTMSVCSRSGPHTPGATLLPSMPHGADRKSV